MSTNAAYYTELKHLQSLVNVDQAFNGFGNTEIHTIRTVANEILKRIHDTYVSKDHDYSENGKPMGNLRSSEEIGIPAWKGVLLRMNDKKQRIGSFISKGAYAVESEKVDDTLIDLCNYAMLGVVLFDEAMDDYCSKIETPPDIHNEIWKDIAKTSDQFRLLAFQVLNTRLLHLFGEINPDVDVWSEASWEQAKKHFDNISAFARKN